MVLSAASPVLWPFAGTDALLGVSLVACIAAMLLVLPLGWILIRRTFGLQAAGPLWPLLFFQIFATFYAFMTPPWLMPDEPQHMFYAELVRDGGTSLPEQLVAGLSPESEEQAAAARRSYNAILASARESEMTRWLPRADGQLDQDQLPGPSELSHPPLYYVVASGLTAPFEHADVRARLALLRTFGVMVTGWAVWLCGAAARMVWPDRKRVAEAPLVLAAGVPTVAAFAGAVNNDAIANLIGAILLVLVAAAATGWAKRRPWLWASGLGTAVLLGMLTKRTILPLVLAVPVALLVRYVSNLRRLLTMAVAGQLALGVLVLGLPAHRLALWDANGQERAYRCSGGVVGATSICIEPSARDGVRQYLSLADFDDVAGRRATLGFWSRGAPDDEVRVVLGEGATAQVHTVPVDHDWHFHRVHFVPPADAGQLSVGFAGAADTRLDLDGIVLTPGLFSEAPPVYDEAGAGVVWDGRAVENLLLNGSGEEAARSAPAWVPSPLRRVLNGAVDQSARLVALWPDTTRSFDVVWTRVQQTFGMFWATVGWEVPPLLLSVGLLLLLALLVAGGWVGAALQALRPGPLERGRTAQGIGALGVCLVIACVALVVRGLPPDRDLVISGRYLFSALVAVAVVLASGWRRLWPGDDRSFRNGVRWFALGTHSVFVVTMFFPFLAR